MHAVPLEQLGGAELSLHHHVAHAPAGVRVDVVHPEDERDLAPYEAVVLANLRPGGDPRPQFQRAWAKSWTRRLKRYRGRAIRSERDVHPCGWRDARCISGSPPRRLPCSCSRRVPRAFEALYDACSAVQFLSPAHRDVINCLVTIRVPQFVIAPPLELERFQSTTPWDQRRRAALILGDAVRVAPTAEERARSHGFAPERVEYLSVPYERMPELYNRYQAVVIDPVMFHAFGRMAVEAAACGCRVLASERVGALSWPDPPAACRRSNDSFWALVLGDEQAVSEGMVQSAPEPGRV